MPSNNQARENNRVATEAQRQKKKVAGARKLHAPLDGRRALAQIQVPVQPPVMPPVPVQAQPPVPVPKIEIVDHAVGLPNVYQLKIDTGNLFWISEWEMDEDLFPILRKYQSRVSGVRWTGRPYRYEVRDILSHEVVDGEVLYYIRWGGRYTNPIWDSQVSENDMLRIPDLKEYNKKNKIVLNRNASQ